jgi:CheY-like chemotaxis protein
LADTIRKLHPLRLQYELLSDANPLMAPIAGLADSVRENRRPAAADNPFIALQEVVSDQIVTALDAWRVFNETCAERTFMAAYGSKALQAAAGVDSHSSLPLRKATKSLLHHKVIEQRIADLKSRIRSGGLREAVIRALIFAGMDRAAIDERGFEVVRRIRQNQSDAPLSVFKAAVREQYDMLLIDTEAALAAIPSMLPDDAAARQHAFDLICEVLSARGQHTSEDLKRIRRIGGLFDADGQLSARSNLAIASGVQDEPQARAS